MVYTVRDIHTLGVKMSSKINWLVAHTSPGALVLQQWLTENGVSYSLAQKYAQNGWLKKKGPLLQAPDAIWRQRLMWLKQASRW